MRYEKYAIKNLFNGQNGDTDIQKIHLNGKGLPVVTAQETNNGIVGYSDVDAKVFDENTITVDMFGHVFFQPNRYKIVTHARVFSMKFKYNKLSADVGMYLVAILRKITAPFEYGHMCSFNKIKDIEIELPTLDTINSSSPYSSEGFVPDFDYMEKYMLNLKIENVKKIDAYLEREGLNDCDETDEDRAVMSAKPATKEFVVGDLFNIVKTKKLPYKKGDLPTEPKSAYDLPARTAQTDNQGLSCYVPRENATVLNHCISVNANGDFGAFWHDSEFTILQDSYAITPKGFSLDTNTGLYIVTCMRKAFTGKYNWNNKSGWARLKDDVISLPVDSNGNPDFDYMEKYMWAVRKNTVRDVVAYNKAFLAKYNK